VFLAALVAVEPPGVAHAHPAGVLCLAGHADSVTHWTVRVRHMEATFPMPLKAALAEVEDGTSALTVVGDRQTWTGALTSWVTCHYEWMWLVSALLD